MASLCQAAPIGYTIPGASLTELDLGSGAFADVGAVDVIVVSGLAVRHDGVLFASAEFTDDLWRIDPADLPGPRVGALGVDVHARGGLTFDACGTLWMVSNHRLFRVDEDTAVATLVHELVQPVYALTAYGEELFGLVNVDTRSSLARIDPDSGTVTPFGDTLFLPTAARGLDFDSDGRLWGLFYMNGPIPDGSVSSIVEYDPVTGAILDVREILEAQLAIAIGGNLGITPPRGPCPSAAEIPAVTGYGLGLFAAAIGLAACALLRWGR